MRVRIPLLFAPSVALAAISCLSLAVGAEPREVSFEDRVAAQLAIERVYHAHRTDATHPVTVSATRAVLEGKVRNYLARSRALEEYWRRPVTAEMLEREVERMVAQSRMPERMAALFASLENDPILIQECLARRVLVDRLVANHFQSDERIHSETRLAAERLRRDLVRGVIRPLEPHEHLVVTPRAPDLRESNPKPRAGEIGPLIDKPHAFLIEIPFMEDDDSSEASIARYRIPKKSVDSWLREFMRGHVVDPVSSVASAELTTALARLEATVVGDPTGCRTGVWRRMGQTTPTARWNALAVWTGSEMIVPAGGDDFSSIAERYDPATDTWTMTAPTDGLAGRRYATAIWTGTEMIVWGGAEWAWDGQYYGVARALRTGGHYSPETDEWWPTSVIDVPTYREYPSEFWTGTELIIWGGWLSKSGAFYGASSDLDEDGYCSPADCDEAEPTIHNGAPEINDGIDNQCPGDLGHGAVDEISGEITFAGDGRFSWNPQEGATLYRVARSSVPDFSSDCVAETTTDCFLDVTLEPDPAQCLYFLVRAVAPNPGSWGLSSDGTERAVACE